MSVEITAIISIVGVLIAIFASGWMALTGFAVRTTLDGIKSEQTELKAKQAKDENKLEALAERVREDELETRDLKGKIPLLEVQIVNLAHDIATLQETQVPRAEWERYMTHVSTQLDEIKRRLERSGTPQPRGYGGGSGESSPFTPAVKPNR